MPSQLDASLPQSHVSTYDWSGVDVARETGSAINGRLSIHGFMAELLKQQYPNALIINDDGAGEIADLAVIQNRSSHVVVRLYHCKSGDGAGADINDLYDVVGQAQRSAKWATNRNAFWKDFASRLVNRGRLRFIQATQGQDNAIALANEWAKDSPLTEFEINIVQPYININRLRPGDNINVLLVSTQNAIEVNGATLHLICAEQRMQ